MRLLAIVYYRQTWGVLLLFYHAFLFNRELFFFILVSLVANFIYDVNNVAREEKMSQAQQTNIIFEQIFIKWIYTRFAMKFFILFFFFMHNMVYFGILNISQNFNIKT